MASICLLAALSFALSRRFSGSKMRTRSDLGLVGRYAFRSIRRRMFCQQSQNPKSTDYQALPEHPDREAHQQQCKICKWTAWGRSTIPRSRKTPGCVESATRKKMGGHRRKHSKRNVHRTFGLSWSPRHYHQQPVFDCQGDRSHATSPRMSIGVGGRE